MRLPVLIHAIASLICFAAASTALAGPSADAENAGDCRRVTSGIEEGSPSEPTGVGAGIVLDEHLLTNGSRDQDYNGGGELTFSGERGGPTGRALDRALGFVDKTICPRDRVAGPGWQTGHAFAVGLLIFTPGDLAAHEVVPGDRPYASLFFLSVGRRYVSADADVAYNSSLTFGIMGLAAARSVQHALHSLTDSVQPQGWSHQISAGGEPTLRYGTARQALLSEYGPGPWHGDSKWTVAGSVGTVTEASLAFNARWGRIESPWWAFTPEQTMYVQETQPIAPPLGLAAPPEVFVFVGARAKLRVYNAFLQGQFRQSNLTYGEGDVNKALVEVWAVSSGALPRAGRCNISRAGNRRSCAGDRGRALSHGAASRSRNRFDEVDSARPQAGAAAPQQVRATLTKENLGILGSP